eukprot:Nitzschia sp. Nitz4//scaffold119_size111653//103325//105225//NITZ4_004213-RA/size111653-augustus-gene-0.218-mRNA-1//1//CDS//3329533905//2169//frame0
MLLPEMMTRSPRVNNNIMDAGFETLNSQSVSEWELRYEQSKSSSLSKWLIARAGRMSVLEASPHLEACRQRAREEMDSQPPPFASSVLQKLQVPPKDSINNNTTKSQYQVDVDDFFAEYPECKRSDWDDLDEESSSDEEDPPVPPITTNSFGTHHGNTTTPTTAPTARFNPYAGSAAPPMGTAAASSGTLPPQSSWDDHARSNPFSTARDVSLRGDPSTDNTVNHNASEPPTSETSSGGGPYIPESLRRKFQPPKRAKNPQTQSNNNQRSAALAPKPGGGVQPNKPNKTEEEEDDELPEPLRHLDKELVKKIQHEILESGDSISFEDIAGLDDAKQTVQEVVCWPMKRPDLFTGLRRAPNGLLLYGPPGTGKTLIGKAIAHESGATFFSISSSSLTSKWIGEGEKLVRTLFAVAAYEEPAVVFIDEIDSLLTQRQSRDNEASRRIKTEFLVQLDGTGTSGQGRVLVIGATNRPQELDEAARRRFTKRLYIPLPTESDREKLLVVLLETNPHQLSSQDVKQLAKDTVGFSGADLKALCTDAAMGPIRQLGARALDISLQDVPPISIKHFRRSLKATKPSVAASDLIPYEEWDALYGTKRSSDSDIDDE